MSKDIQFLKDEMSEVKQLQKNAAEKSELAEVKKLIKDHADEERQVWEKYINLKADRWVEDAFRWGLYLVAGVVVLSALSLLFINTRLSNIL